MHDVHFFTSGLMNPISEGAIGLFRDQKAAENDNGLGQSGRAARQGQVVLIT